MPIVYLHLNPHQINPRAASCTHTGPACTISCIEHPSAKIFGAQSCISESTARTSSATDACPTFGNCRRSRMRAVSQRDATDHVLRGIAGSVYGPDRIALNHGRLCTNPPSRVACEHYRARRPIVSFDPSAEAIRCADDDVTNIQAEVYYNVLKFV